MAVLVPSVAERVKLHAVQTLRAALTFLVLFLHVQARASVLAGHVLVAGQQPQQQQRHMLCMRWML